MDFADAVLQELDLETRERGVISPERWILDPPPFDREVTVEEMWVLIDFPTLPTAARAADVLESVDREARRVARGMELRVPPASLTGRGVRLVPREQGLILKEAKPGSLTAEMLLGGLYTIVTSQPLSFALNLAALLGYGRAVVRALRPSGREEKTEIEISGAGTSLQGSWESSKPPAMVPTSQGPMVIPLDSPAFVRVHIKNPDGTEIVFESDPKKE